MDVAVLLRLATSWISHCSLRRTVASCQQAGRLVDCDCGSRDGLNGGSIRSCHLPGVGVLWRTPFTDLFSSSFTPTGAATIARLPVINLNCWDLFS